MGKQPASVQQLHVAWCCATGSDSPYWADAQEHLQTKSSALNNLPGLHTSNLKGSTSMT
eukprot:CAMPEP_0172924624 /NCGR_PEP_ID=MMETSP1075-20121228/212029_1 /TAXON_ID=2916 /ORGANISM="Ceratium fusus, Strain PA161109" /LENGTH=58 /DNA_ID=CAMNT_0013785319 /DNA_START=1701 /DNA_END=1874 /DNA_ORIENTATION=-